MYCDKLFHDYEIVLQNEKGDTWRVHSKILCKDCTYKMRDEIVKKN